MKQWMLCLIAALLPTGLTAWGLSESPSGAEAPVAPEILVDDDEEEDEDEQEMAIGNLPYGLVQTLLAHYPGAEIEEAELEFEDGRAVYEVEIEFGDLELEVELAQTWTILEVEADDEDEDEEDEEDHDEDED